MDDLTKLKQLFNNVDPQKLSSAVEKAQALSQNPNIRKAFAKTNPQKLASVLANLNESDRQRLISELQKPENTELLKAIKDNL